MVNINTSNSQTLACIHTTWRACRHKLLGASQRLGWTLKIYISNKFLLPSPVRAPGAQGGQTSQNVGVWSRERLIARAEQ